ncbi:MAG: monofunctional biosynthetic peptidoglycan transglycosylase [Acidobacteria bacterium]|nr:monofunctional biosynthetic peptidoglycan transglycosylase [Acidobacteriota bacterium]
MARAGLAIGAVGFAVVAYVYLTLPDVRVLVKTNPSSTAFMELRSAEAAREGRTTRRVQRWVPYSRISQSLKRAVLVAEDAAFWEHEGVDVEQIRESIQASWERGRAIRGASTITQQLAKNLYLSPSRDPLRKLRELIIARRLEAALSKARIFEIYLNVIEWGDGIWGADAAARTYFGIPASALSAQQAALLAGAIMNPRVLNPARPTARLLRRQQIILGRMGQVTPPAPVPVAVEAAESPDAAVAAPDVVANPIPDTVDEGLTAEPRPDAVPVPEPFPNPSQAPDSAAPPS